MRRVVAVAAIAGLLVTPFLLSALAQEARPQEAGSLDKAKAEKAFPARPTYSPYAGRNFPTQPYFGDTQARG